MEVTYLCLSRREVSVLRVTEVVFPNPHSSLPLPVVGLVDRDNDGQGSSSSSPSFHPPASSTQ